MLRPNTHEDLQPVAPPRDCVVTYQIGPDKVLLISYNAIGGIHEQFTTNREGATSYEVEQLVARMRKADQKASAKILRSLRIVKG